MRKTLLTSAALLGLALAAPAVAQTTGATGSSGGLPGTSGAASQPGSMGTGSVGNEETGTPETGVTHHPMRHHHWRQGAQNQTGQSGLTDEGARPGHSPGVGNSEPMSTRASNIDQADTRSQIAPRLPMPPAGESASPAQYVRDAQNALARNRTGEAQEAIERAETRLLDMNQGNGGSIPGMDTLEQARQALGHHDLAEARRILDQANFAENGPGWSPAMGGRSGQQMGMGTGGGTSSGAGVTSGYATSGVPGPSTPGEAQGKASSSAASSGIGRF